MYKKEEQENICQIFLEGEMTIYNVAELKAHFTEFLDDSKDVDINLGNITEIDSSGIQLLIWAKKAREQRKRKLSLSNHSPEVLEVFELLGLITFFNDPVVLTANTGVKNARH